MAEEKKDVSEITEFEAKLPAQGSNKDIWLFLIIVDVVFLCVFGFFLYKNLSARLLSPAENVSAAAPAPVQEVSLEVQEPLIEAETPAAVSARPEPAEEPAAVPAEQTQPEQEKPAEKAQPAEQKDSVIVQTNPKSKYRRVTFRYYGEGKDVSVVSGFTMAKPRALKKKKGYWETTLSIAPGTYKFLYIVDGVQTLDPYSEEKDGRSLLVLN